MCYSIIELVSRHWSSMLLMAISIPMALIMTLLWFPFDFGMLFLTYIFPLVPFVFVFDGFVSALRIRTFKEVMALAGEVIPSASTSHMTGRRHNGWNFEYGDRVHTWPIGYINWIVGIKKTDQGADHINVEYVDCIKGTAVFTCQDTAYRPLACM